jgi:hypothetical protein
LDNNEKETLDEDINLYIVRPKASELFYNHNSVRSMVSSFFIHELTRHIVNKLDNNEKETLDEDINLDEISKVIKILKPNKSPGEDGIISEFYQLFPAHSLSSQCHIYNYRLSF